MDNEPTETKLTTKQVRTYAVVVILLAAMFGVGYATGEGHIKVSSGKITITKGSQPATSADYTLLWDALNELNSKYVDRPLDQQKLLYGAVSGLVAAAGDPYTTFFNPDDAKSFQEQLSGSFDGIGAEVGIKDGQIVIIAPIEDTPASKAGLQAGDAIISIDGVTTSGMSTDDAVGKIRGKAGTQVKLNILHKGKTNPVDITITRASIQIKSVKLDTKTDNGKKIAVLTISEFGDDTKGLVDQYVGQIATGNYSGVILDLRNDPGGYLDTAVSTISNWIDPGQVAVKEIGYGNDEKDYKTDGVPRLKGMKTIILANGGSASASEIVTGALQDYGVATLVGEKTFGKGSVQELDPLGTNSEIKITVAKWYTPKGRGIHKIGLNPDITVTMTADDVAAGKDPQMDKALDLLK